MERKESQLCVRRRISIIEVSEKMQTAGDLSNLHKYEYNVNTSVYQLYQDMTRVLQTWLPFISHIISVYSLKGLLSFSSNIMDLSQTQINIV